MKLNSKIKNIIISYRANKELLEYLDMFGIKVIKTIPVNVDKNIDDHPDVQVFPVSTKKLIVVPEAFDYYKDRLKDLNVEIIKGESKLGNKYPEDVYYNISKVGKYYIGKKNFIDKVIEREMDKLNYEKLFVKQGYARCSCVELTEGVALTSDSSIYESLKAKDLTIEKFTQEGISLPGYDEGFLGGTCGMIDHNKILFSGDIRNYKDYNKLMKFLENNKIRVFFPRHSKLVDIGGLIPVGGYNE